MNLPEIPRDGQAPLESWKEIAAYLQRDATTVRRWEKEEGLPVHRHAHKSRSSVYSYPSEIDAWRALRKTAPKPANPRLLWRVPTFALAILLCVVMVGNGIRPQVASAQQRRPVAKRVVCSRCGDSEASISRDGRWMVLTDWVTGDLTIRDMSSGKVKRLLAKTGTWRDSPNGAGTYGEFPVISPDSRQIVYLWELDEKAQRGQLRVMPNEPGGKSRVLIDGAENIEYHPQAWFPDGKSVLLAIQKADKTWQLSRVQVSDGVVKVLKPLEWRLASAGDDRISVSPDGQYIAYSALAVNPSKDPPAASDSKDRHIYILTADGSSETEIVKTSGINRNPVWTSDAKHILFTSDRSGKTDLWSMAMQNGKATGAASLVSADVGDVSTVGIYGGSYYMYNKGLRSQGIEYIHIVEIAAGGNAQGGGARETESFVGIQGAWSPDGKSIAFKRHHPGSAEDYDLVVHSLETGEERTYLTNIGTTGGGKPFWFHDGKSILTGLGSNGSRSAFRIGLETRVFTALPQVRLRFFAISQDDKTLYLLDGPQDGKTPIPVVSMDLNTGQVRTISGPPVIRPLSEAAIALSPDGRTLALGQNVHVARMSVDGSGFRELYSRPDGQNAGRVAWSGDGRSILFDQEQPGGGMSVMRIPAEGGPPSLVFASRSMQRWSFDLSPDGLHLAFGSSERSYGELWALDNVLSTLK